MYYLVISVNMAIIRNIKSDVGGDKDKREPLYDVDVNANYYNYC